MINISKNAVEDLFSSLSSFNSCRGYFLNPDTAFTKSLIESLLINDDRYGYQACPCRLASGERSLDLDIICPCDYRDSDVAEFGACYCGLYVSRQLAQTGEPIKPIPERRPTKQDRLKSSNKKEIAMSEESNSIKYPIWRCEVCGYLCARDEAPDTCPICGVSRDRFAKVNIVTVAAK
ncbi:MAG: ferredoxin:glutaredoxin reductase [Candidatus Jacksonbacteria bacterium RIFOXYC2_FULL_44_29]|nr:MAG: Rubredoxin-type Fe(Cys)4 protein [Parcubacteria group bacterium GW2011_GWA2_42_28]KKT52155.1 MAG: Rubredoxin-type Fe(Cys)4 protein [Parcubacteria group bacterium GW2011_GWC2_44_22]OGY75548.1 MAG: ferredoxin:glutaredoxin reductase [Candidatus Jacksonbacteria bacterium RIFOXYB2_FULL_44_15]OGY75852.1 MAG: ferredoxin:glutaredoxin reductase [Candidatus Jacksonbacteria bacterium RIFOXYA2_FULL_43_12]OGY78557.1 MAG: ferredoxin:glutaredoxin reductase [Candidatus Jacksonbacteria bacterium RIFOXYC